jgi:hypothetical protein
VPALVSVRAENVPGSNWVCRSRRRREPRGSERTTTLERERAGTSMFFGNLGASAEARPEVPEVPGSESSKGHLQSRERSVTRTTSMGESGHFRSLKPTNSLPQSGRSDDSGPVHLQRLYSSIMATYGMGT